MSKPTFEESLPCIIEQVEKRRKKWNVHVSWIDFDDIRQLLLIHIFKKWSQFDPERGELSHWVSSICSAQIKNHWRNLLGNTVPPCECCPANEGGDKCKIFQLKDPSKCAILKKWEDTKREKYNLKLAANIEDFSNILYYRSDGHNKNYEEAFQKITILIKNKLTKKQYMIYEMLYIKNIDEEEVGRKLGYKTEEGRKTGYSSLLAHKKKIMEVIKRIIRDNDII
jgi:hypothetical protein